MGGPKHFESIDLTPQKRARLGKEWLSVNSLHDGVYDEPTLILFRDGKIGVLGTLSHINKSPGGVRATTMGCGCCSDDADEEVIAYCPIEIG